MALDWPCATGACPPEGVRDDRRSRLRSYFLIGILISLLAYTQGSLSAATIAQGAVAGVPGYDHIFFVIDENRSRAQVIGPAPYLTGLANANAQSSTYYAVTHPSVNNYLALFSGQTYSGITDKCIVGMGTCHTSAPNLADEVVASGRTARGYMESMPSPCYGPHDAGPYTERHNPFLYFDQIRTDPGRCASVVPYTQLASDLTSALTTPNFAWITPNVQHDMHSGTVAQGDAWAQSNFPAIFSSPAWTTQRSLLIFTFDEDNGTAGNNVAFFAVSSDGSTKTNYTSTVQATPYSALRTIEAAWGLGQMTVNDAAASPMSDLFKSGTLRAVSSPALPTQIVVDGEVADSWSLNWLKQAPGVHKVCFTHVEAWTEPPCQTMTVNGGATAAVTGLFTQRGMLRVITSPAVAAQIAVDGNPTNDWGMWTDIPTGAHTVCWGKVVGWAPPSCQKVTVHAGATTTATGTFTKNRTAVGQAGVGLLRVATAPALPSQIMIKPSASSAHIADTWALNWLELAPGSYTVSFSHVEGYTEPAPQTVTVTAGATTTLTGNFTRRGWLRVITSPSVAGTISVDGIPRDDWGMWTDIPTGSYMVCFGPAVRYANTPACQTVIVNAGAMTTVTGAYR